MRQRITILALLALVNCGGESPSAPELGTSLTTKALTAWSYTPGTSYFGSQNYVEFIAGDAPVIFTAAHGGTLRPTDIPVRTEASCGSDEFATVTDANTEALAREIQKRFFSRTGKYPHIIINLLARDRLDANRPIEGGACGDPQAEQAWRDYHGFIQAARDRVVEQYGAGWYTDVHGHGHGIQRLELGYNVTGAQLRLADAAVDADPSIEAASSINVFSQQSPLSFSALLRGSTALGTLLAAAGLPATPSAQDPAPAAEDPYFNGGYSTERYGCVTGSICGVQIESNYTGVRDGPENRAAFAVVLADVYDRFLPQFGLHLPVVLPGDGDVRIIDNLASNDDASWARVRVSSNWLTGTNMQQFGTNFRFASASELATDDNADFLFYVPASGTYAVDAWWPSLATRSAAAAIRIFELDDGPLLADLKVDQRTNGQRWNPLGTFRFSKVGWAKVQFSRVLSGAGTVAADAVRVTFSNHVPSARFVAPVTGQEGAPVSFDGSVSSDPDGDALSWRWDLGDGTAADGPQVSHTYANDGVYSVSLTVTDPYGLSNTFGQSITVTNVAPSLAPLSDATVSEGDAFTTAGTFSDPGADAWTASVDYGDGSGPAPLALSATGFLLNHRYTERGVYTVEVRVNDGQAVGVRTAQVTVQNVPPTVGAFAGAALYEGETYASAGSFVDPGADAWTASVDYGDGQRDPRLSLLNGAFALHHRYSKAGRFTVTVEINDGAATGRSVAVVVVRTAADGCDDLAGSIRVWMTARTLPASEGVELLGRLTDAQRALMHGRDRDAIDMLASFRRALERRESRLPADAAQLDALAERVSASIAFDADHRCRPRGREPHDHGHSSQAGCRRD